MFDVGALFIREDLKTAAPPENSGMTSGTGSIVTGKDDSAKTCNGGTSATVKCGSTNNVTRSQVVLGVLR